MKVFVWNCRGLGTSRTIRELRNFISTKNPHIICILESKSNLSKMEMVRVHLGYDCCFAVPSRGKSGGVAVFWRSNLDVQVINYSFYHIDFLVQYITSVRFTLFYGCPTSAMRGRRWDLITRLSHLSSQPWCIAGDFNEVLNCDEVTRLTRVRCSGIDKFRQTISHCQLFDLGYQGSKYTYSNKRKGNEEIKCRLDRAFADS
ncbi:unnamed protein product [Rhodiola kirilowii]